MRHKCSRNWIRANTVPLVLIALYIALVLSSIFAPDYLRWIVLGRFLITSRDRNCTVPDGVHAISPTVWTLPLERSRMHRTIKFLRADANARELWQTPIGEFWVPRGGSSDLAYLLTEFERKSNGSGDRAVKAGDIVLDCGANLGTYTREALLNGASTVVAIEPAPENVECLRRTFETEISTGRVILYPKGVWDHERQLMLSLAPGGTGEHSLVIKYANTRGSIMVDLTSIDTIVSELKLARVDFIKMDIEGAERNALAGARTTIARFRPRMAISGYHLPDDTVVLPEVIRSIAVGYSMECGPCFLPHDRIVPETLFFRWSD